MDRKEAVLTIEDGVRKLRLLDAKGKVWTQDMILQVDAKSISLIDNNSKVQEHPSRGVFPAQRRNSCFTTTVRCVN